MTQTLERVAQMMENTMGETLGIQVLEATGEKVVATMPVDRRTHQPAGLLHGGASVALAETVASIGGFISVADQGKIVVGLEINANHVRPVTSGLVKAVATSIHKGVSTQIWDIRIHDENSKLVCISRCTLAVRDMR